MTRFRSVSGVDSAEFLLTRNRWSEFRYRNILGSICYGSWKQSFYRACRGPSLVTFTQNHGRSLNLAGRYHLFELCLSERSEFFLIQGDKPFWFLDDVSRHLELRTAVWTLHHFAAETSVVGDLL